MVQGQNQKIILSLAPQTIAGNSTVTVNIDTIDGGDGKCGYAVVLISFSAELNTNATGPTISLLQSDDTVVSNFATITANRTLEDLTTLKNVAYGVDLRGRKRYLRLSVSTPNNTNEPITFAVNTLFTRNQEEAKALTDIADVFVAI